MLRRGIAQSAGERRKAYRKHQAERNRQVRIAEEQYRRNPYLTEHKTRMKMLERLGFEVICADSGEAGVRLFQRDSDSIVAVLLDVTMPGMDGPATFSALREIGATAPVLFYSGYTGSEIADLIGGSVGFIEKPFTQRSLSSKLHELLNDKPEPAAS